MAKGYWIVRVDITDQEQYKSYVAANAKPLAKYGARFWCEPVASRIQKAPAALAMR